MEIPSQLLIAIKVPPNAVVNQQMEKKGIEPPLLGLGDLPCRSLSWLSYFDLPNHVHLGTKLKRDQRPWVILEDSDLLAHILSLRKVRNTTMTAKAMFTLDAS